MDRALESTFSIPFTTRAFATGIPTTLLGSPVLSVLEGGNATPITAGVSVSVDRASVNGLNEATIIATAANGFEAGKSYALYISTGTVDGVSVVGEVVGEFSIDLVAAQVFTTQMTESYAADGVAPTPAQSLMMIQQMLGDFFIEGTTLTVRKVDGVSAAATYNLNDATIPTALTRAS